MAQLPQSQGLWSGLVQSNQRNRDNREQEGRIESQRIQNLSNAAKFNDYLRTRKSMVSMTNAENRARQGAAETKTAVQPQVQRNLQQGLDIEHNVKSRQLADLDRDSFQAFNAYLDEMGPEGYGNGYNFMVDKLVSSGRSREEAQQWLQNQWGVGPEGNEQDIKRVKQMANLAMHDDSKFVRDEHLLGQKLDASIYEAALGAGDTSKALTQYSKLAGDIQRDRRLMQQALAAGDQYGAQLFQSTIIRNQNKMAQLVQEQDLKNADQLYSQMVNDLNLVAGFSSDSEPDKAMLPNYMKAFNHLRDHLPPETPYQKIREMFQKAYKYEVGNAPLFSTHWNLGSGNLVLKTPEEFLEDERASEAAGSALTALFNSKEFIDTLSAEEQEVLRKLQTKEEQKQRLKDVQGNRILYDSIRRHNQRIMTHD